MLVDQAPNRPEGRTFRVRRPAIWGGMAVAHFGHFVAEQVPRILAARDACPDWAVMLLPRPDLARADLAVFHWQVLDWLGVRRRDVIVIDRSMRVSILACCPQAESLGLSGPDPQYLDLLDRNAAARKLQPIATDTVFVMRCAMAHLASGHHAGEGYVAGLLGRQRVRCFAPERHTIREQMAIYAGARHLVFAEGSALHGRQLLGRVDQTISVLCRRPGRRLALAQITPRVRSLDYREVTRAILQTVGRTGRPEGSRAMSIYDPEALLRFWACHGVDLQAHWSRAAYEKARDDDIRQWARIRLNDRRTDRSKSVERLLSDLQQAELPRSLVMGL